MNEQFESVLENLKEQLSKIRTSRANPSLVEDLMIEAYPGTKQRLKELATISVPEPRQLLIKPWDKGIIKEIEKGLVNSDFEFNPVVETEILRINLPELTQESREQLVKQLGGMLEEARVKLRTIRDGLKKEIESKEKSSAITEDDKYKEIEQLDKTTREFTNTIDEMKKKKEEEIMTI